MRSRLAERRAIATAAPDDGADQRRARILLAVGLILVALNLRTTVTSLPPFGPTVERALGISAATLGLLTSLPVLCMALFAAPAHRLTAHWGRQTTILAAVGCIAIGNALRLAGGQLGLLFTGTLIVGVGVAACGVILPAIIKDVFPARAGLATGASSVAMLLGAAVAGALAVPLEHLFGSWQASLAAWAIPAVPAFVVWRRAMAGARDESVVSADPLATGLPWRARGAWLLAGFFALQAALAYAYLAWLAPAYEARGWTATTAGILLGALNLAQLVAALALPVIADRSHDRRATLIFAVTLSVIGAVWLFALPRALPWLATAILGFGLGGAFTLTLVLLVDFAVDPAASGGLAAMVFLIGYCAAAISPVLVGALRDASGGYGMPFGILALVALAQLTMATLLGPRYVASVAARPSPAAGAS